jgi:hypothetical protein
MAPMVAVEPAAAAPTMHVMRLKMPDIAVPTAFAPSTMPVAFCEGRLDSGRRNRNSEGGIQQNCSRYHFIISQFGRGIHDRVS